MMYGKIGLRNFWRQKRRNIYTLIAVTIGCAGLISLSGYISRWDHTLRNDAIYLRGAGTLSIYKKDGFLKSRSFPKKFTLLPAEQEIISKRLKDDPAVDFLGSFLYMTGLASNGCSSQPFEIVGYDPQVDKIVRSKPEVQRWCPELVNFHKGQAFSHFPQTQLVGLATGLASLIGKSTVLSEAVATPAIQDLQAYCQGPDASQRIAADPNLQLLGMTFDGQFGAVDVDIAHIFSTGTKMSEDTKMTAPLGLVQELYQTDNVSYIAVYLKDFREAATLAQRYTQDFKQAGLDLDIHLWKEKQISPFFVGVMSFLNAMGVFCGLLIGIVVVLCVVNLTTMNVMERSREIGTLKALGFRQGGISCIFIVEAAVIGLVGCTFGLGLSSLINQSVNSIDLRFSPPGFASTVQFLLIPESHMAAGVLGFIFALVLISSGITSYQLSKRSCLELLTRHSG